MMKLKDEMMKNMKPIGRRVSIINKLSIPLSQVYNSLPPPKKDETHWAEYEETLSALPQKKDETHWADLGPE